MEPFALTLGTQVQTFSLDDDGLTIVITHTDAALPGAAPRVGYEACESEAEAAAVLHKLTTDLARQGWAPVA